MLSKYLLIVLILCFINPSSDDAVITWREDLKLTWNEFNAVPKPNASVVAITASGITFEYSVTEKNSLIVSFNAIVYAHFYPNKSWVIIEQSTPHILNHEQLHFDITELHARKFRKQLSQLKVTNSIKSELQNLHDKIKKDVAVMQKLYDQESNNSVNREFQTKWDNYIRLELDKLDLYKSID